MTYLSDTARVVLAAAAQRDDLSVLPFPDTVKAKGGAEQKVLTGLKKRGFVRVFASSMKDDLRYTPSDCFETFPFPPDFESDPALEAEARPTTDFEPS